MKNRTIACALGALLALVSGVQIAYAAEPTVVVTGQPMIIQVQAATPVEYSSMGMVYGGQAGGGTTFTAGIGVYYLQPDWEGGNTAYITSFSGASATTEFEDDYYFSPRLWGAVGDPCGLELRGSWWRFDQGEGTTQFNEDRAVAFTSAASQGLSIGSPGFFLLQTPAAGADNLAFESGLFLDVYDLEVAQNFLGDCYSFSVSAGARYAYLSQNYNAYRVNAPDETLVLGDGSTVRAREDSSYLSSGHSYWGVGPTVAVTGSRKIFQGLCAYGIARGSVLYGERRHTTGVLNVLGFSVSTPVVNGEEPPPEELAGPRGKGPNAVLRRTETQTGEVVSSSDNDFLWVAEVEIGVQYTREFGGSLFAAQAGIVGQNWFDAGNASSTGGDLRFYGLTASAGFRY
jgi:hypothetical protein